MQKKIANRAKRQIKTRKRYKTWQKVVGSLACMVVFVTTYMLILPAITMEQKAFCGMEEHKHDASCYEEKLICNIPESQEIEHVHDETCTKEEQVLKCSEEHEHIAECYETETLYTCDSSKEIITHEHVAECYEKVFKCNVQEHDHSLSCFSNPNADIESETSWKKSFSDVKLTGNWADDLIAIAETQKGYSESKSNYLVTDAGDIKGITRYGQWYGDPYGDWCAMFISFCMKYAEIPQTSMPYEASCNRWIEKLSQPDRNCFEKADAYVPRKGDLIFFDYDEDKISDHVGIVIEKYVSTKTNTAKLKVIEGNSSDKVSEVEYEITDANIMGYGRLPKNPDKSVNATLAEKGANNSFHISNKVFVTWDEATSSIKRVTFTASNSQQDQVVYQLQYKDSDNATWMTASKSEKTGKNSPVTLDASSIVSEDVPLTRVYRVYGSKDNNHGSTTEYTLYDLLDLIKPGFQDWLKNSYVQDFGGTSLPTNTKEAYHVFSYFYTLPTVTIHSRMDGNTMYVDAQTTGTGTYRYQWQYLDEEGKWVSLCKSTEATIDASSIALLQDGGKKIRCNLYENGEIKAISEPIFVNPRQQMYDKAIKEINSGLGLGTLEINGTKFKEYFYYGNVARDNRVPFSDAKSYADYLAKLYLDNGGGKQGLSKVKAEWDKYLYDLYDPSNDNGKLGNLKGDYPGNGSTYGDNNLGWPKDSASSFHGTLAPKIDPLNYSFLEDGVDYSNFISNLSKKTTTVAPGDQNAERKYDIELVADAQAKARGPVAMILQIQTSWQMFNFEHANALKGDGFTEVGAAVHNTELANLYDIKQALLRFVDYMEMHYPGNNLVLGITETQHAGSQTMLLGNNNGKNALYVTNNYDILRDSIRKWDSFGNCEHVHYDTKMLEAATGNLSNNLSGWKDFYGSSIKYEDIQKVAVIIGGPTENSNSTNGYGCALPWNTFQSSKLNSVYGIRTNMGQPLNSEGILSWLDYSKNNTGAPFKDGSGTAFTAKYVATTEDAVFNSLVKIANKEMLKKGQIITAEDKFVENVEMQDTVSDEFVLDPTEPITMTVLNKDGSIESKQTIPLDDPNLTIKQNIDGTTMVRYIFDKAYNTKKYALKFRVQAKEDYIGSNNVYSNLGTPDLNYIHKKIDITGKPTGENERYDVQCTDTPQVNVPIRFDVVDGDSVNLLVGDKVDLADLSTNIAKNAEELVDNYDQINGTLSYTWILPDGREYHAGSVQVSSGSIGAQTFPDRSSIFTGTKEGNYTGTLKVTFTPEKVDPTNTSFSDKDTAVAVKPLMKPGDVWIHVFDQNSTVDFFVRKVWKGDPPRGVDSVRFRILANGIALTDDNGKQLEYTLSSSNNWETKISELPTVKDGVVQNYTVEEIDLPPGYLASYSSESRKEDDWAAKVRLSFTPENRKDNVSLKIEYTYNGELHTYYAPTMSYKKDSSYYFDIDNLPLNKDGEPYPCEIQNIWLIKKDHQQEEFQTKYKEAKAEKYLRGSTNTDVKVITNSPAYELPQTGGQGTKLYAIGGILMIISALTLLLYNIVKQGKGDECSS